MLIRDNDIDELKHKLIRIRSVTYKSSRKEMDAYIGNVLDYLNDIILRSDIEDDINP